MNFKRLMPLLISVLVIIALSVAWIPTALADDTDAPVSLYEGLTNDEDPRIFGEIYAEHFEVTVDEAMRRFELQGITGELDAEVTNKEAETFAGLWIEHTPEFKVVVLFTRDAEETIKPYLQSYPDLAEIIEVRTAEMSLVELQAVQYAFTDSLMDLGIPTDSEVDVYKNRVKVFMADQVQFDNVILDGKLILPDCVDVITVEELMQPATEIYAGLTLTGAPSVTSGFAVINSGGTRGITTAGHCNDSQSYAGYDLPYFYGRCWAYFDVQWHTAPDFTVTNKVKYSSNSTFRVISTKSRSQQSIGAWVAKYGRVTGFTAGLISSKTVRPSHVPSATATFIRVDNSAGYGDLCEPGDSGAPWFYWGEAWGIMSGYPTEDPNDAIYMAIDYVSGIGVSVLLEP